jgi:phage terminase large subunit-like protein
MSGVYERHAVLPLPGPRQVRELGVTELERFLNDRIALIRRAEHDPLRFGWEPPVWHLCDALLGFEWVPEKEAEEIRLALGFKGAVSTLLINGGNRAGKSEYAAKRLNLVLSRRDDRRAWAFQSSAGNSIEMQQPVVWRYMPVEWRREVKSAVAYVSYKQKMGFSEGRFVVDNGSECTFRNYEQEKTKIEGGECDFVWADELIPPDWVETLGLRIATRNGRMLVTFTPVQGYSATVKLFQDGAKTVLEETGWLLPKGNEEPDLVRQLGFRDAEEMGLAEKLGPNCVAGDPMGYRQQGAAAGTEPRAGAAAGTEPRFERVPRVMKCLEDGKAVVFFYSSDNPFGNPRRVWEEIKGKNIFYRRERFYGLANKTAACMFPKFGKVHIVPPAAVPRKGSRYMVVDPCSGRNFFMLWGIRTPQGLTIYREWPGTIEIPGYGAPGLWAIPDGKKADGRAGPAQKALGFGLLAYKREIARLEGWKVRQQGAAAETGPRQQGAAAETGPREWDQFGPAEERIALRFMDSRFADSKIIGDVGSTTLLDEFEGIGLSFLPTCTEGASRISEGVAIINDWLDYDETREVDYFNRPRLFVSEECVNLIFALQNWTGQDGTSGACKDPVDCLRYLLLKGVEYLGEDEGGEVREGEGVY